MAIPESVRKQAERSEALMQQSANTGQAQDAEPTGSPEPAEHVTPEPKEPVSAQQTESVQPPPEPMHAPAQETQDAKYWENRAKVITGKYQAEVPKLHDQVKQLTTELNQAKQELAQAKSNPSPQTAGPVSVNWGDYLSQEQLEDFGEILPGLEKIMAQMVNNQVMPQVTAQTKTLQEDIGQLRQQGQQNAKERFWAQIDAELPDFDRVNEDQGFNAWLYEIDPYSGVSRKELLDQAVNQLDAPRVVRFFKDWSANGRAAPQPQPTPIPDKRIMPTQSSGNPPVKSEVQAWRTSEISQFYKDQSTGQFKGREDEAARIEKEINAAYNAGRIIKDTR